MTSPNPQHKFRVLQRFDQGKLCPDQAGELLQVSERTLHQLQTIWQADLPKLVPLIDSLLLPKNTKHDQTAIKFSIALALKISYRQVNRLLKSAEIAVPAPKSTKTRLERRENAQKRRKDRVKWAIDVIFGHSTVEDAAEQAFVSTRQMYRLCGWACNLAGVTFRDLHGMDLRTRARAAQLVEKVVAKEEGDV